MFTDTAAQIRETFKSQGLRIYHGNWVEIRNLEIRNLWAVSVWSGDNCLASFSWPVGACGPVDATPAIREQAYRELFAKVYGHSFE